MENTIGKFSGSIHGASCSCCKGNHGIVPSAISRRKFVQVAGTAAVSTVALSGLSWSVLKGEQTDMKAAIPRQALVDKPIFTYEIPVRREQTSWRNWGGDPD
jgi:hypothetical protein